MEKARACRAIIEKYALLGATYAPNIFKIVGISAQLVPTN
jgi:hypothetical protein